MFGSKQDRDVATYMPVVEQVNEVYAGLSSLTNDELRNRTLEFRSEISDYLADIDKEIVRLN